jgi:hypothetical protein
MRDCHTLFVMEGSTDVLLLRALLQRLYNASCESKLKVARPMALDQPFDAKRSKYHVRGQTLGLCDAVGGPRAIQMIRTLATLSHTGGFPMLRNLVLVRDIDKSDTPVLQEELTQDIQKFASCEDAVFELLDEGPWLCRVHNIAVGQILLGDPSTPGNAAIEDHMLGLLKYQPDRDPSKLTPVAGAQLTIDPSPKQQVLLAMVKDDYWTAAARFYDNVLESASDDQIKSLADQIRFTELMKRLTGEQPEG